MSKPKLLLFPCNGNAREALDAALEQFDVIGFIDDIRKGETVCNLPVFDRTALNQFPEAKVLAVPGSPANFKTRKEVIDSLQINASRFTSVVHSSAVISRFAEIGINCVIMAGSVVMPQARVGNHCCVLANSVVHHDSELGDYSLVASGVIIAGNTTIGENCYLGAGSRLINNMNLGAKSIVGIGATVIQSFPDNSKLVGVPARSI